MSNRTYQICTKTIMDTSDPKIIFNEKGESDFYLPKDLMVNFLMNKNKILTNSLKN